MFKRLIFALVLASLLAPPARHALACGGLFCQNVPVDQNAERIIFQQNDDGTITALIQIQYTGRPRDFAWILPLPEPIHARDLSIPETGANAFRELEIATAPLFLPPRLPECAQGFFEDDIQHYEEDAYQPDVSIYTTGEVGPYSYDVIGSDDPGGLLDWLDEHHYRVDREMEALIRVYVREGYSFLAMRLLPGEDDNAIQPIEVTYRADQPSIPLRLTAGAAQPDTSVLVWIYADRQAVPENVSHLRIDDEDLNFYTYGGNNYRDLLVEAADRRGGQGFVTEYAAPTRELAVSDPYLQRLARRFPYVTRLNSVLSPEEMTIDPSFWYDPFAKDVSNIHDLTWASGLYECEREEPPWGPIFPLNPGHGTPPDVYTAQLNGLLMGLFLGICLVGLLVGAVASGVYIGRRERDKPEDE